MRSDLVFGAMGNVPNRYLLAMVASKAVRAMHKPGVRIEDTTNDVLARFSRANPIGCNGKLAEPVVVSLRPKMPLPVISHKSKVVRLTPARETLNPLWEAQSALRA